LCVCRKERAMVCWQTDRQIRRHRGRGVLWEEIQHVTADIEASKGAPRAGVPSIHVAVFSAKQS
jgi:hypothetical protein